MRDNRSIVCPWLDELDNWPLMDEAIESERFPYMREFLRGVENSEVKTIKVMKPLSPSQTISISCREECIRRYGMDILGKTMDDEPPLPVIESEGDAGGGEGRKR